MHNFLGESTFINVPIKEGKAYPKGHMEQALDLPVPADAAAEMVVATRPNEIALTGPGEGGYATHVEACNVHLVEPMWYSADDEAADKERALPAGVNRSAKHTSGLRKVAHSLFVT